jgi:hypothetical protein
VTGDDGLTRPEVREEFADTLATMRRLNGEGRLAHISFYALGEPS